MCKFLRFQKSHALYALLLLFGSFQEVLAQVPVITSNPRDTTVCFHNNTQFSVTASNNPTGYIWQRQDYITLNWVDLTPSTVYSGLNTNTLTVNTSYEWHTYYRCIATNASGSSATSAAAYSDVTDVKEEVGFIGNTYSVCQGATDILFKAGRNDNHLYKWTYTGTGATINFVSSDSIIAINFASDATPGNLVILDTSACGVAGPFSRFITVTPLQPTPAGILGGAAVCYNSSVTAGGTTSSDPSTCNTLTTVLPSGASPVSGTVQNCVTVDATVQSYNGIPYVQRHYNIEPSTNAATATATLTLYYTQADFDAYNLARGSSPALPANSSDAAGIANLRIAQFHGTGTTPGSYVGGSGEIDPLDNNIVWNAGANRWEITFDVTGFSGFFVSTGSLAPLPLTLLDFNGQITPDGNLLQWTTASEQNTSYFEVQRNYDGGGFKLLTTISAAGNSQMDLHYQYTDPSIGNAQVTSYRLKMADLDGKFSYSKTIVLQPRTNTLSIRALPNPFHQLSSLTVYSPQAGKAWMTVTDISGKRLQHRSIVLKKGTNNLDADWIGPVQKGIYLLTIHTDLQQQTIRLIRE